MDFESEAFVVSGTLQANGKAAGSATQQDAESGMLVVHGIQDPCVADDQAFALRRNRGQENALLAFSCKDHGADAGDLAPTLRAMGHGASHPNAGGQVAACITGEITHALKAEGFDASEDGTGRGQPMVQGGMVFVASRHGNANGCRAFPATTPLSPIAANPPMNALTGRATRRSATARLYSSFDG